MTTGRFLLWLVATGIVLGAGAGSPAYPQSAADKYDDTFRKYSKRFFGPGFDWRLFKAQAMVESNLDPAAKSWVGARGVMQLMPTTFREVQSQNPEFHSIDDPVWNIAAGICYDRHLWKQWTDPSVEGERIRFVLGSYNAGRSTLLRARSVAERKELDANLWTNIRIIAHEVPRWRHTETFGYVDRIETNLQAMDDGGGIVPARLARSATKLGPAAAKVAPRGGAVNGVEAEAPRPVLDETREME